MQTKVIIIGLGFTSRLCLIRSVAQLGCHITVIAMERKKPLDGYSKYANRVIRCKLNNSEGLMKILLERCIDEQQKPILIPNNDFSVVVLDSNLNKLKDHFILPNIGMEEGAVVRWMNKEKQKELAFQVGLNVANSVNIEIKEHTYIYPTGIQYPCFTKTRAYQKGYKGTLHRCDNELELRKVMETLRERHRNITIMVEEYKDIKVEYAVVGYSNGKDVIIPGVLEVSSMAEGSVKGVACQGKVMPIKGYEELIEKFKKFMLEIGFIGLFDIDFYIAEKRFYFGELNLRIGGSACAIIKMGVNLPVIYVKDMLGISYEKMKKEITDSAFYTNERICSENWYEGFYTTGEFIRISNSHGISFVKDKADPIPEIMYKQDLVVMGMKRIIKKILKKCKSIFCIKHKIM